VITNRSSWRVSASTASGIDTMTSIASAEIRPGNTPVGEHPDEEERNKDQVEYVETQDFID
jgi:hypothetical protein